jgi:hypothetical protein
MAYYLPTNSNTTTIVHTDGTHYPISNGTVTGASTETLRLMVQRGLIYDDPVRLSKADMDEPILVCRQATPATAVTAAALGSLRSPIAGTITGARASLHTASTSGAVTVNVTKGGTSIFTTVITLDQDEKTTATAATPAVLKTDSTVTVAVDDEIVTTVSGAGTGAAGLSVWLLIERS